MPTMASDLSKHVWNGIADLVRRSQTPREVYFVTVTKADKARNLVWAKEFGDVAIPLVAFSRSFSYYDTVPTGVSGATVTTEKQKREDATHKNANYLAQVVCPKVGELIAVLDPWGAKRYPVCFGVVQSKTGFWEGA